MHKVTKDEEELCPVSIYAASYISAFLLKCSCSSKLTVTLKLLKMSVWYSGKCRIVLVLSKVLTHNPNHVSL